MIISVEFKVNSKPAIKFRTWANLTNLLEKKVILWYDKVKRKQRWNRDERTKMANN